MRRNLSRRNERRPQVGVPAGSITQDKRSATIIAVARPWIERLGACPPLPAVEFAYQTCGAVWNVSRLDDAITRQEEARRLRAAVASAAPEGTGTEVRQLCDMLYERALAASPEDRRMVVNLQVVDLGGGSFRVDVASVTGEAEA